MTNFTIAGRAVHGNEIKFNTVRAHIAAIKIEHAVIEAARHGQAKLLGHGNVLCSIIRWR